ncbi:MAG: cell division protein ZapB [Desulfobacterales bacterium]
MDDEQILKQFESIESKVGRLIDVCRAKDAANVELTQKIEQLEEELQKKAEVEIQYKTEKDQIRSRIDQLLSRLEEFTGA